MSRFLASTVAVVFLAVGCSANPPMHTYVLSGPATSSSSPSQAIPHPRILLRPVSVPDYLDTADILTRRGEHELKASSTGQWGERLSQGLTHALIAALVERLPQAFITGDAQESDQEIAVNVDAFDAWTDGHCVLVASWKIRGSNPSIEGVEDRGTFVIPPGATTEPNSDGVVVAAMTSAIDQLADRIVISVRASSSP